jgi:hypothetical protein
MENTRRIIKNTRRSGENPKAYMEKGRETTEKLKRMPMFHEYL